MNIYTIYKAVNTINGKVYIGFDSKWPRRKSTHKYSSKEIKNKFYDAIKKYGWDNFEWSVIYQSKDRDDTLKVMEPYFIKEHNSFTDEGYNLTSGGEGVFGLQANRGKKVHTEEFKKRLSDNRKGENNPMYGKKHTLEHTKKVSAKLKGRKLSKETLLKMSSSQKGRKKTEEQKRKIQESLKLFWKNKKNQEFSL